MRIAILFTLLSATLVFSGDETVSVGTGASFTPRVKDPVDAPTRMAQEGIKALKAAGVMGLCDAAFAEGKTVNNPADRRPATANFQRLHDAMTARYGKTTGEFEFVRKEVIGQSLVKFTYLEKLEKTAVVWKFAFYHVDGGWKWKDLGVTDNLDAEYKVER